jgi:DNA-directed RNA polymerase I subunit RPA43
MTPIQKEDYPLLHIERVSQYVALSPAALNCALPALCAEIFSPLLLGYYAPVKGIVLGYEDVKLSGEAPRSTIIPLKEKSRKRKRRHGNGDEEEAGGDNGEEEEPVVMARQIDEYSAPYIWATASLLVWRPQTHTAIPATLTHASATHITLAHLNTFPISVLKAELPSDWSWHQDRANAKAKGWDGRVADAGGWWVDGLGERVKVGVEVKVWIVSWEVKGAGSEGDGGKGGRGVLGIVGSLVGPGDRSGGSEAGVGRGVARTIEGRSGAGEAD